MTPNKDDEICKKCGAFTKPLFHTLRFCEECENPKKNKEQPKENEFYIDFDDLYVS